MPIVIARIIFLMILSCISFASAAGDMGMGFFEFLHFEQGSKVYLHSSTRLNKSDVVSFQYQVDTEGVGCCKRVEGSAFTYIGRSQKVSMQEGADGFLYRADPKSLPTQESEGFIGIAVINSDTVKGTSNDKIRATKDGDEIVFEQCYGIEGINLYEKRRERLLEHLYYYLNIDIEATCA